MSADSLLTLRCPACGVTSDRVPVALAGRKVRCVACGAQFRVPEGPAASDSGGAAPTLAGLPAVAPSGAPAPAPTVAEARPLGPVESVLRTAAEAAPPEPLRSTAPAATQWRPGDVVLGLYEVVAVLGEGGMGRVYRVRHRGWGLDLAVKVPLAAMLEAAGGADLFEREAETWVNLGLHPHVVTCHYVRRLDGLPLVFAEYVDGGSLHDGIRAGRFASLEDVLDVAIQFAWGLHHAHEQGLVHRDVKPANVMLTCDGLAKVTDFGLARSRALGRVEPGGGGLTMTVEGGGGATPAYVSPEQARGEVLSRRSDLWSFALCVLELFLGARTWEFGLAAPEVLEAYRANGLRTGARPEMPAALADLLGRCFRDHPDERPHDLSEVATRLRELWESCAGRGYSRREPKGGQGAADAMNNRAASLVDLGRWPEATTLWRRALESEPHHVEATFNATLAAWTEGRVADPELLRKLEEACGSHPSSARGRQLLGRLQLMLGQPAEARASFERAAALGKPDDLEHDAARAAAPAPPPERALRGLTGTVAALALTPDGSTVVAGSGHELRAWQAADGRLQKAITLPEGPVRALLAMADGQHLLVAAEGAPLALWDLTGARQVRSFARQTGHATCLAALPAGLVLAGGSDRIVRIYDQASGQCVREMAGHEDAVTAVAAGETVIASAGRDATIRIWSPADGRCLATLRSRKGRVQALALFEAESRLVSAGEDGAVYDWGLRSHALVHGYLSHAQPVQALALSADGTRILSGAADCTLRGFDAERERLASLTRFDAAVAALAIAGDGTIWVAHGTLVTATRWNPLVLPPMALCRPASALDEEARASSFEDRMVEARRSLSAGDLATAFRHAHAARSIPGHERAQAALTVWDELCERLPRRSLLSAWEQSRLEGHEQSVLAVAIDPARARVATASLDGTVRSWSLGARRAELVLRGHEGAVTGVAFVPDGPRLLSSGRDRTVRLWQATTGAPIAVLEGHGETAAAVAAAPDGVHAASASWDGTVRVWDLRAREARVLKGHAGNVASVCFSADGQVLASAGWDGTARLWDPETGAPLAVLSGHDGNVTAVALHPGGRQVATGCEDHAVRVFDPRSKRLPRVLRGHQAEVTGLAFTSDGRFLLSSSRDRTVRVFDLRTGETVRTLPHPAMVLGIALAPAGSLLVAAGAERAAQLWHLDWEPEPDASAPPPASTVRSAGASRTMGPRSSMTLRSSTLREDLRRAAPGPVAALRPRASVTARRLPWRWIAVAAAVALATALSTFATRAPTPRLDLSTHAARSVPREVDLIELAAFSRGCASEEYAPHLERLVAGNPDAHDVACVAAQSSPGTVSDALQAPLSDPDPLTTRRLRRNAASVLAGLSGEAMEAVCDHLGDEQEGARFVAALALGVSKDPAADACVRRMLTSETGPTRAAAGQAMRQRIARRLLPVSDAWRVVERLLASPDRDARLVGLELLPLFTSDFALPAARKLTADPDPEVAAAAGRTAEIVVGLRRADELLGRPARHP